MPPTLYSFMRVACERGARVFAPIRGPFDDDRIRGLLKVTRGNKFRSY
jgi:hypothetical protein